VIKNFKIKGFGKLIKNGIVVYEGEFKNNKMHGIG